MAAFPTRLHSRLLRPDAAAFTPSYFAFQGYLNRAGRIDAQYARAWPGGSGQGVIIADVEYSFNQTHEDLKSVPIVGASCITVWRQPCTAVLAS